MTNILQRLFKRRTVQEEAASELDEARRELLRAQTARDYADAMVKYREAQIKRLEGVR